MNLLGRYGVWLEAVSDLLDHDHAFFPRARIAELIDSTMDAAVVTWQWAERAGGFGCELNRPGPSGWTFADLPPEVIQDMQTTHPLLRWFHATADPRPMSVGRVPRSVVPECDFAALRGWLAPVELEQQLSIPYRLAPGEHRAFVLGRGSEDFSDDDVELARRVQPILALLDKQIAVTQERQLSQAVAAGLTAREVAVLALLSGGGTAEAIARRLSVSPRTVHNHLQHIYRKLGVGDRMRAVLAAQAMGIIGSGPGDLVRDDRESPTSHGAMPLSPPSEVTDEVAVGGHGTQLQWMLLEPVGAKSAG